MMKKYVAYLIDLCLNLFATSVFLFFQRSFVGQNYYLRSYYMLACAIIILMYLTVYLPVRTDGQTLGMILMHIKVENIDKTPRTFFQSFLRELVLKFSMAPIFIPIIGCYLIVVNGIMKRNLRLELPHDIILNTRIKEC